MAEAEAEPYSLTKQAEQDAYLAACSALLLAIANGNQLTDEERAVLIEAMPTPELSHNLACGLIFHELIATDNQVTR